MLAFSDPPKYASMVANREKRKQRISHQAHRTLARAASSYCTSAAFLSSLTLDQTLFLYLCLFPPHFTLKQLRPKSLFMAVRTIFLLWVLATSAMVIQAQSPSNGTSNSNNNSNPYLSTPNFNPSMAIVIVILISAFFFLGFFSIYIRQCGGNRMETLAAVTIGGRSRRQRGLDPSILDTFPILVYSEVKEHKIGKGALECAICLNEFEDEDTIRLLPKCDHVFHQECIDAWLSTHVTCPVCRTNYAAVVENNNNNESSTVAPDPMVPPAANPNPDLQPADHPVVISVHDDQEREEEIRDLARIASKARGNNGSRRGRRLPRSHSTGHSIMRQGDGLDRYTLRLPEHVRKEIISAGALQRSRSVAVGSGGEGSSRRGFRGIGGEGSNRRGRSVRLGRTERWPSFVRSLSMKIPAAWGNWRRGEDGSVKGSPAAKGKVAGGGGGFGSKHNPTGELEGTSTAGLNRV